MGSHTYVAHFYFKTKLCMNESCSFVFFLQLLLLLFGIRILSRLSMPEPSPFALCGSYCTKVRQLSSSPRKLNLNSCCWFFACCGFGVCCCCCGCCGCGCGCIGTFLGEAGGVIIVLVVVVVITVGDDDDCTGNDDAWKVVLGDTGAVVDVVVVVVVLVFFTITVV